MPKSFLNKGVLMLFTKASEYALLALIHIARNDKPKDVDSLSAELNISKSFLAKILQTLAKDNLLQSFKGAKGGFILAKKPEEYTIKELIDSVEKKEVSVFECSNGVCPREQEICQILPMIMRLQQRVDDFLSSITLADIIKE